MTRFLVHVGYAKCGSTWLQSQFFPNTPELNFIGRQVVKGRSKNDQSVEFCNRMCLPGTQKLSISERLRLKLITSRSKMNIISHENVVRPTSFDSIFENLALNFKRSSTRILVVIRRQTDLILSRYSHDLNFSDCVPNFDLIWRQSDDKQCYYPNCQRRGRIECVCADRGWKPISKWYYDFEPLYNSAASTFGTDAICVLPLEGLMSEDDRWRRRLIAACDLDWSSRDFFDGISFNKVNQTSKEAYRGEVIKIVDGVYKDSNSRLNKMLDLGLDELGYDI